MAISRSPKSVNVLQGRDKRQARVKNLFVETAHELLVTQGRERLSLREVARRNDYSPAAIYEYFSSKEKLIDEVAIRITNQFASKLGLARNSEDPITAIALAYVNFAKEHQEDFLLIFGERRSVSEHLGSKIYQVFVNTFLSTMQGSEKEKGAKRAYKLWVAIHGLAMLQITHFGSVGSSTSFEHMHDFVSELSI